MLGKTGVIIITIVTVDTFRFFAIGDAMLLNACSIWTLIAICTFRFFAIGHTMLLHACSIRTFFMARTFRFFAIGHTMLLHACSIWTLFMARTFRFFGIAMGNTMRGVFFGTAIAAIRPIYNPGFARKKEIVFTTGNILAVTGFFVVRIRAACAYQK